MLEFINQRQADNATVYPPNEIAAVKMHIE